MYKHTSFYKSTCPHKVVHFEANPFIALDAETVATIAALLTRRDKASLRTTGVVCYLESEANCAMICSNWVTVDDARDDARDARRNPDQIFRDARRMWMQTHMRLWLTRGVVAQTHFANRHNERGVTLDPVRDILWYPSRFRADLAAAGRVALRSGYLNSQKHWPPEFGREVRASNMSELSSAFFFPNASPKEYFLDL